MSRPLVVLTVCFICGIIIGHYFSFPIVPSIAISFLLLLISLILFYRRKEITVLLLFLAFLSGIVLIERFESNQQRVLTQVETIAQLSPLEIDGRVVDSSTLSKGMVSLTVDEVKFFYQGNWDTFSGKILVNFSSVSTNPVYYYGDRIRGYGILNLAPESSNPDEFNYREYLVQTGVFGIFHCWQASDVQFINIEHRTITEHVLRLASKIKQYLVAINSASLPPIHAALLNGIVLGEKSELADDIKEAFIRCGIFHLLVVSGSNVMLVAFIVYVFLKFFRIKRRVAAVVSIPVVILYALIAGFQPPVTRATIMSILVLFGLAVKKDIQIINNIGIAALIGLIFNPLDIFGASFQLSFLTVLGIVLIYPILVSWYTFPKRLLTIQLILYSSIAAFIGIAPLSAYYFNILPLISPVTNLIATPIVSLILPSGFLTGFLCLFTPSLAQVVAYTNWLLLSFLIKTVNFLYFIPGSYFYVGTPSFWFIGIYYIFLLSFVQFFRPTELAPNFAAREKWLIGNLSFIFLLLFTSFNPWSRTLSITFLSVGQGDSIFLRFPDGKMMLIDGGTSDAGKRVLVPYLRKQGVHRIDTVVLTHPHNDHVGGLVNVIENIPIGLVVDSGQEQYDQEYYPQFRELIREKRIPMQKAIRGECILAYSGATIRILHPPIGFPQTLQTEVNNNSIVLQVIYGRVTTLLAGDVEQEAESDLIRSGVQLTATILKVPHHGSATSLNPEFLTQVHPQIAVISVGSNNWFGLPAPETVKTLKQQKIQIYRTDRDGAIIIRTDGEKITVEQMRK